VPGGGRGGDAEGRPGGRVAKESRLNKLGKYEILEELGRGAMGVVYKARDPLINRLVAMKTITSGLAEQPDMLERFYREAQAAGGLQHPNIVTIYDLGEENKTPYIAMELLDGISLEKVTEEQHPLPLSQKIGYIVQVCRALDYAHKRGVVHRDIKPANIQVKNDGTIKVMDFGIARLVDTSRSQTGLLIGTVNYMSPEQVRGERVDGRSDIFSVGVMFYELLSFQRPFTGANFTAVMLAIISQEHKPVSTLAPEVPPELDAILGRILKKDVNDRYQTMEEILLDLEPLHRKLQAETVSGMVKQTQSLVGEKKLEEARDVLRQALLIDSTHREARTLLEKVNAELKRSLVGPKVEAHVSKAQKLLEDGKLAEAQTEVDAALKLDSVYQPAQDLLKEIAQQADRAKKARDFLKAAQQQLAEGNLTEAHQQVDKLLEMDAKNALAQKLLKQITEERERRAKRQRLLDSMQKARGLWTQQKYDECIKELESLQKEFPGEEEIAKLLETVRSDQEEQTKHEKLSEARRLLGEQHFAESLAILDKLLERNPNETTIQKLRAMVVKERKEHAQRVRLQHEQQALKKLVNEENFKEAISKGEQLLKEFPDDFELTRLVEYARTQHAQIEQQRRLKGKMDELQALMTKGEFQQAVTVAEKALDAFPGNLEFARILEDARNKHKEKEKKEFVEKQIRSIKAAIDTGNLTDAIDLGRQTLAQVKHDTDVTRLLQFAEREHEMREKKRETDDQLKTAVFLMESKKFEEATKVLENVQKTVVFDPRVHSLLEAAKSKESPKPAELAELQKTIAGIAGVSREQEYVLQVPGGPGVKPPAEELGGVKAQATPSVEPTPKAPPRPVMPPEKEKKAAPSQEPAAPAKPAVPPPAPPTAKPPVEAPPEKKKKGKPAVEEPEPAKAKPAVEPPKPAPAPPKPAVEPPPPPKAKPAVEEKPKPAPAVQPPPPPKAAPSVAAPPVPAEEPKPFLKSPAGMAVVGVLAVAIAVGGYLAFRPGTATSPGPGGGGETGEITQPDLGAQQQALLDEANQLANVNKFTEAVQKIDEALKITGGPLTSDLNGRRAKILDEQKNAAAMAKIWEDERKLMDAALTAYNQNNFDQADRDFKRVVGMKGGRRQSEAQRYVSQLIPARKQEENYMRQAERLANSTKPEDLQNAKGMLETVAKGSGPRKTEAQNLLTQVQASIDKLGKEAIIQGAVKAGRDALGRGDYNAARSSAAAIKAQGGDAGGLESEINRAEQGRLTQLMNQFNQLKGGRDPARLEALQGEVRRFVESSGNATARDLAENQIPTAVTSIRNTLAAEERDRVAREAKAEWDGAQQRVNAAQGRSALQRVVPDLERIAGAGGAYAAQARDLLASVQGRLKERPCPTIPVLSAGGGLGGGIKEGQVVAASMLDTPLKWTSSCNYDVAGTGTVRLSLGIDESGNVTEVKPRGRVADQQLFDAIAAAARAWKVTPPKAKGLAVKTEISIDVVVQ